MKQVKTLLREIDNFQKAGIDSGNLRTLLKSYKIRLESFKDRSLNHMEKNSVQLIARSLYEREVIDTNTFSECLKA